MWVRPLFSMDDWLGGIGITFRRTVDPVPDVPLLNKSEDMVKRHNGEDGTSIKLFEPIWCMSTSAPVSTF